ncbi:phosphotransferase family protein [Streptomyces sp. NPDC049040]|uniref:phosphotransferase family protein n=1 Tax=Streptomyces sp. NPDC049040 TaxID=3365593 RepID=UPI00371299F3
MTDGPAEHSAQASAAAELAAERGWQTPRPLARGVEFVVFATTAPHLGDVVLRVPRARVFQTANNVGVSAERLLEQEYVLGHWLRDRGFPVAEPVELLGGRDGIPVLVSRFVESDGSAPHWEQFGALLARLHQAGPPDFVPVLQYGLELPELIARRLPERYARLRAFDPAIPEIPAAPEISDRLRAASSGRSLMHLDPRRQNLLCRSRRVAALIDWSNTLIGDPRMELARLTEYAAIEENGLDAPSILRGYSAVAGPPARSPAADLLYRLDTAVMLALVFRSVAPDPLLGHAQVDRVLALTKEMETVW